jgi:hypothetical protein
MAPAAGVPSLATSAGAILRDRDNKVVGTLTIEVLDGQIQTIRSVIKPNKLKHVDPVADAWAVVRELSGPAKNKTATDAQRRDERIDLASAGSPAHGLTGRADCAPRTRTVAARATGDRQSATLVRAFGAGLR